MNTRRILLSIIAVLAGLALAACGYSGSTSTSRAIDAQPEATDYANPEHWLSLPTTDTKPVDVFYFYPSEYTKANPSAPIVGPVNDPGMMQGAKAAFTRQATAFAPLADIHAPCYRQAIGF